MKIVYPVCCGVDVHKNIIVATIAVTDKNNITQCFAETFPTLNSDLIRFRTWLLSHECFDVCMESTGKYWIPVYNILEEAKIKVLLTHPKYVRSIKGKKIELILQSIRGCHIKSDQRFKMKETNAHMKYLDQAVTRTEAELYVRIQPYYHIVNHLSSQLPGISQLSAALIIAEIGADMSVFESAKHLNSWAGLAPANNESAGKKKSVRISKAGQFLKPLLVQCALAAVKNQKEPYFAAKYQKLKKRRGHKRAIIAIARMLITCIYHMIKNGEVFNPSDYQELRTPAIRKQVITDETAIAFLAAQGYDVSVLSKISV